MTGLPRVAMPVGTAPLLSLLGLILVGAVTMAVLGGNLPALPGIGGGQGGAVRSATPSNVVIVDPRANAPGSLLYVKAGNIWVQSGSNAHQLTTGGADSTPTWSPDGSWIYFVRTAAVRGKWPFDGTPTYYDLQIPSLLRISADGSGTPKTILTGQLIRGAYTWSFFIREPTISPDVTWAAIVTDGPDPTTSDVVVKLVDLATGALRDPKLPEVAPLGLQDPAWSPDGQSILYVKAARVGERGTPSIERYDLTTKRIRPLTGPGYISPDWSPDGRFVAATRTDSFGTDVVILDARTGAEPSA